MIETDSIKTKFDIEDKYPDFAKIYKELVEMSFDRETLLAMINDDLEQMERNRSYETGLNKGIEEGKEEIHTKKIIGKGIVHDVQCFFFCVSNSGTTDEMKSGTSHVSRMLTFISR